jgi:predicted ArsR family transcriptional regulator
MSEPDPDLAAIALLEEPTRRRLYDWVVAQRRPVGREEAARATGVTRALATFHLDRLAEAGLLRTAYQRLTGRVGPGAGRPARVYERTDREIRVSLPERRYERVADLFARTLERLGNGMPPPALVQAAREVGEGLGRASSRRQRPQRRLLEALRQGGYEPDVEPDGTIRLGNCPFHALAEGHRGIVCGTNLALAAGIVDATSADLTPRLDPQPGYCCVTFAPR